MSFELNVRKRTLSAGTEVEHLTTLCPHFWKCCSKQPFAFTDYRGLKLRSVSQKMCVYLLFRSITSKVIDWVLIKMAEKGM